MTILNRSKTVTVDLMPVGNTFDEAIDEALYTKDLAEVDMSPIRTAEVERLTLYGKFMSKYSGAGE